MIDPADTLELIRAEIAQHFTMQGEYTITSPTLITEIRYVFERAYTARFGYKPDSDPHKQDALQDLSLIHI